MVKRRVVHVKLLALDPGQGLLPPAPSFAESSDDSGITAQRIRSARIEYKSYYIYKQIFHNIHLNFLFMEPQNVNMRRILNYNVDKRMKTECI